VRAELEPVVRRSGYDSAALAGAPALEQAIRETLRLYCAVPIVTRNTAPDREVELGGHVLPPDTTIFLSSYAAHLDPRSWPDADEFLPARWSPEVIAANPYGSGKFWPFGRGTRACAGRDFALAYLRATLAVTIVEFDVQVGKGQKFEGEMFFACVAAKGLEMSVAKR
jgi:cytochrome P450